METYGVGVVVLLFNADGDILLGERTGSHGAGTWSLPGGGLEFGESALMRITIELWEETGLVFPIASFATREWIDNIWDDPDKGTQHWITLFTEADHDPSQTPRLMEPGKCKGWEWVDPATLLRGPRPLFYPLEQFLIKYPYASWNRYREKAAKHRTY